MPPKSRATVSRTQLAAQIHDRGFVSRTPCDFCVLRGRPCFQMLGEDDKLKCAACTWRGRSCVSVSWESLNMSRDNLREDVAADEATRDALFEQLATVQARLSRKRKVLEGAEVRARQKLQCLVKEMESDGEDLTRSVIDASLLQAELFGPAPAETVAEEAGSSRGS